MDNIPDNALLLRFQVEAEEGTHILDAWVDDDAMTLALGSAQHFDRMLEELCEGLGMEFRDGMDRRNLTGLPVGSGHPLRGQWIGGCPMGMEGTQPVPTWNFAERVKVARTNPHLFPVVEGEIAVQRDAQGNGIRTPLAQYQARVKEAMAGQFGTDAVLRMDTHKIRTYLDDPLDGMSF